MYLIQSNQSLPRINSSHFSSTAGEGKSTLANFTYQYRKGNSKEALLFLFFIYGYRKKAMRCKQAHFQGNY